MVGADVLGGPRTRGVPVGVPVCAARRVRRALPCGADRTWGVDLRGAW